MPHALLALALRAIHDINTYRDLPLIILSTSNAPLPPPTLIYLKPLNTETHNTNELHTSGWSERAPLEAACCSTTQGLEWHLNNLIRSITSTRLPKTAMSGETGVQHKQQAGLQQIRKLANTGVLPRDAYTSHQTNRAGVAAPSLHRRRDECCDCCSQER